MKAIVIDSPGPAESLYLADIPPIVAAAQEVLVKVHACSLNRADILQRCGKYPAPVGASSILGLEIAGEVVALGSDVDAVNIGDRVCGIVPGGGYAEYCVIDHKMLLNIPPHLSYTQAAAIPECFITADEALRHIGALQKDEVVLIHCGASGVGTAALQIANLIGAKCYFTTRTAEKIAPVLKLVNAVGINSRIQNFSKVILSETQANGVDLILDFIGDEYFEKNIESLSLHGRMVMLACMSGQKTTVSILSLLQKCLSLYGFSLRPRSLVEKRKIIARFKQNTYPLFCNEKLTPIVDRVFDFSNVVSAHKYMEQNKNIGKIVLELK